MTPDQNDLPKSNFDTPWDKGALVKALYEQRYKNISYNPKHSLPVFWDKKLYFC